MENPLLVQSHLPIFSQIMPEHLKPAIDHILANNRELLKNILIPGKVYTPENLILPLEKMQNELSCVWSPISHLNSVMDNPDFRLAHDDCLAKVSSYYTEVSQNEALYKAYQSLEKNSDYDRYSRDIKKVIQLELRNFRLSGVGLNEKKKQEFKKLQEELSELESQFEHNVLDATANWFHPISEVSELDGLPPLAIAIAAERAQKKGLEGWILTLDYGCYAAVLSYAKNRNIRQLVYEAGITKASEVGPNAKTWDNGPIMERILEIRQKLAKLLDFNNFAEYSLAKKMAKNTDTVMRFLQDLAKRSKPFAAQEISELKTFALQRYQLDTIEPWDLAFLSENLCKEKYDIDQELLRPYFPENIVLAGLFKFANKIFNITIKEEINFEKWDDHVKLFSVYDNQGTLRGQFFFDPFIRDNKRSGAWVGTCRDRIRWADDNIQIPVAYLVTNFTPPEKDKMALLTHEDVVTLFHEFGHCLHHVLTKVDYATISGNNSVEWDAVELPSQLFENWAWEEEAIEFLSGHIESGKKLPIELVHQLKNSKNFQAGMQMIRQLEFSLFDFTVHMNDKIQSYQQIQEALNYIRAEIGVVPIHPLNRFQNTFCHIFGGAYAAGYYGYKWAEVLSADAYSKFEQEGIFNARVGNEFKSAVLEQGAAKTALELFVEFRGREPNIDALLKHSGLES